MVGLDGLEPSTPALSRRCSNQLSYRPGDTSANFRQPTAEAVDFRASVALAADKRGRLNSRVISLKGGDPAAPSDTATLLRLHPRHEPYRGKRPPCG